MASPSTDQNLTVVRISDTMRGLSDALRDVIGSLPGQPRRPVELQRVLGIRKDLARRVIRASEMRDPLASALVMPGPAPLRELLDAARATGAANDRIDRAHQTVDHFEHLIRDQSGDRMTFDGIVGSYLPETRGKRELFAKQSVHRGIAQVKGSSAETMFDVAFFWPGENPDRLDGVWLLGWFGLQRLKPRASMHFLTTVFASGVEPETLTLAGDKIHGSEDFILNEFSTIRPEDVRIENRGVTTHYIITGDQVGRDSACDVVLAAYIRSYLPRRAPERRFRGPTMEISAATKLAILDVFLHEDVFPGIDPELRIYDTTINGIADMDDPLRDCDLLDMHESVTPLGRGAEEVRVSELPNYTQMIHHVFEERALDPSLFRGYRCRTKYPVYGTQFAFCFQQGK